jgi:hypothetical protein
VQAPQRWTVKKQNAAIVPLPLTRFYSTLFFFRPDTNKNLQYIPLIRMTDDFIHCLQIDLEINEKKNKRFMTSRRQTAGQDYNTEKANTSSENVSKFKHLPTTVTRQNWINKEIKRI